MLIRTSTTRAAPPPPLPGDGGAGESLQSARGAGAARALNVTL
jgi:hypothetical protein